MNCHTYRYGRRYLVREHLSRDGSEVTRWAVAEDDREIVVDAPELADAQAIASKLAAHDDLVAALRGLLEQTEGLPESLHLGDARDFAERALAKASAP